MLTATCMQRRESRAAAMVVQGAAVGPVFARRRCRTEPASSHSAGLVEVVGEVLAALAKALEMVSTASRTDIKPRGCPRGGLTRRAGRPRRRSRRLRERLGT